MEQEVTALRIQIAVLEERVKAGQDAIRLQATEYERRLTNLNHAHEQQVERNAEYVPRELFEQYQKELDHWRNQINQWRWITIGASAAVGGVLGQLLNIIAR